ncbi:MAG: HAD hydrolase-like protein [Candidatus Kaelpia aquatica]|nr:HAD hydrolase-like protein [Candidatus Kaelpia aquatica]
MIAAEKIAKKTDKTPLEIYDLFFASPLTERFDAGLINEKSFFEEVKETLNIDNLNQEDFYEIWNNIFWENKGVAKLIKDIKLKFQSFFIVSNINKVHFKYIWDKFPVVRLADKIITSYSVGVLKPDPVIYQKAIEEAKCNPEEIFYTDDRSDLIQAAKGMDFNVHLFQSVEDIRNIILN